MKKLLFAAATFISLSSFANPPADIDAKVIKAFNETFAYARDVVWNEMDGFYEVTFKQNDIQSRVQYDAEGNVLASIRYYSEQQLPLNVLAKVKKNYAGKKVFGVTEVANEEMVVYEIVLEDEKNWIIVQADAAGTMVQKKKYKKA